MTDIKCKECQMIIIEDIENKDAINDNFIQCPYCGRITKNPLK